MNFDKEKFVSSAEINTLQRNIDKRNKEGVEIFNKICKGKDVSKYGDKVDKVMTYMKDLGEKASNGDPKAQAEINSIREVQIEAPLLQRINLFNYMGDFQSVGYGEELRYKVYQLQGKKAGEQANSGSFPFPTQTWREEPLKTTTITGGIAVDYRELQSGNTDAIQSANEQVITDMMNQMFYHIIQEMYDAVKDVANNDGIAAFAESSGLNKSVVDDVIKLIRRWGPVTISSDYSMISQMEEFAGFTTNSSDGTVQFSDAVMEEIRNTGLLRSYKGANVVEIPNTYNLTKVAKDSGVGGDNDFFETYLPEGLMFFLPRTSFSSPLQVGQKGGVTSMTGQDLSLRLEAQRFDMEFGAHVIKEYVPMLGLISDSDYDVDKR